LTDRAALAELFSAVRPDAVVHRGAVSFVPDAASDPGRLERVNVGGTVNLFEAAAAAGGRRPAFLFVSTAQVLDEPRTAYAASKAAAESEVLSRSGRACTAVIARPANHTGPGQSPRFVVPSFIRQALEIKRGVRTVFSVGNLDSVREFTDVRDVVSAYRLLLEKGEPGAAYEIGSGRRMSMRELLRKVAAAVGVPDDYEVDPEKWRPTGVSRRLDTGPIAALGWRAAVPFEKTISDMVAAS
ncbi:MAG: GDP-mannose 4,6-dehydratase, partial [Kiritimatiellae bacterium]|nr:GDP-mannose 4,6-dehydratase [Kiritimatiellia bacterium]